MCDKDCINFGMKNISIEEIKRKKVIEVGSYDINGSLKDYVQKFEPEIYVGVDIIPGKNVDVICDVVKLFDRFEIESFDVLISTEVLEHVQNWRLAISNFKKVLKTNGFLIITTRSKGFGFHEYPHDFWRYEEDDFKYIFSDFIINSIEKDTLAPGIFIKATKPKKFNEVDLSKYELYNIVEKKRTL